MQHPSVCIVGAGTAGLCTALFLARRGARDVTVIERAQPAAGSSGISVGVIETQYVEPVEIELRAHALHFFRELERDHRLKITRTGYLRLAKSAEEAESYADSVEYQHSLGVDHACIADREQIAALAPHMALDGIECGLWGPDDGFVDGYLYCSLLAELGRANGVIVRSGEELLGAERLGEARHRLITTSGTIDADYVVNAGGAWAPIIGERLGASMPIKAQRHEAVFVHLPQTLDYMMPMVMDYTPHSGDLGLYFRHDRDGQLVAGLHSEEETEPVANPDHYARKPNRAFLNGVAEKLENRLPSLAADCGLANGWAGLYPVSPDGVPQVGPSREHPTIICAGGAGGSGIQLSPVIGELAADWITAGEPRTTSSGMRLDPRRQTLAVV